MPQLDTSITVTVDASKFFTQEVLDSMYQLIILAFQKSIKSPATSGSAWVWEITAPSNQSQFESYVKNGRNGVMEAVQKVIMRELKKGKRYMTDLLMNSRGGSDITDLGVDIPALSRSYLKTKGGGTHFFKKTGEHWPQLLATDPRLVSSSGYVFTYQWKYDDEVWEAFNVGMDNQPSRPVVSIYKKWMEDRLLRVFAPSVELVADSYNDLARQIEALNA